MKPANADLEALFDEYAEHPVAALGLSVFTALYRRLQRAPHILEAESATRGTAIERVIEQAAITVVGHEYDKGTPKQRAADLRTLKRLEAAAIKSLRSIRSERIHALFDDFRDELPETVKRKPAIEDALYKLFKDQGLGAEPAARLATQVWNATRYRRRDEAQWLKDAKRLYELAPRLLYQIDHKYLPVTDAGTRRKSLDKAASRTVDVAITEYQRNLVTSQWTDKTTLPALERLLKGDDIASVSAVKALRHELQLLKIHLKPYGNSTSRAESKWGSIRQRNLAKPK